MSGGVPPLRVDADLRLEVDGVQAHLSGSGDRLVLATEHPVRLARAMRRHPGSPRSLARAIGVLRAAGVSITVEGRHGPLSRQLWAVVAGGAAMFVVVRVWRRGRS